MLQFHFEMEIYLAAKQIFRAISVERSQPTELFAITTHTQSARERERDTLLYHATQSIHTKAINDKQ